MAAISRLIAILSYAVALCGVVPLFAWLETVPRIALAVGFAAGIWQDLRRPWPLRNWMINASIVPVFLYYASQFSRSNAVQPVVTVLAIMLAVRLLSEKSPRHHMQIHALSLFCLASSSLFDLRPAFLLYLSLMLFMVAVSLVLLTFQSADRTIHLARSDVRQVVLAGLAIPLASLPLLLFFFPLLPRTQIPLWEFLTTPAGRTSGYTDKVEPGGASSVGESRALAFRAEVPRQPHQQLYWRGTVFNRLEGRRWVRDPGVPSERVTYRGRRISQVVYLEPSASRTLFSLDAPAAVGAPRARRQADGTYEAPLTGRRQVYTADSVMEGILPVNGRIDRRFYLELPPGLPARIRGLADDVRRGGNSDAARLERLEQFFRTAGFRYALSGLPTGDNAMEQFLFETRVGHCEYFASAFATLLRASGVPARIVGGYLGGEYNELGGYYLVSEQMAHVWVEAYLEGEGWRRVDPSSFAANAGTVWNEPRQRSLAMRIRMAIDSFDHRWNRSVINYDFERQVEVARMAGRRLQALDAERTVRGLVRPVLWLAGLSVVFVLVSRRGRLWPSPEQRLLARFYRQVARDCQIEVQRGKQGLFELAEATGHPKVREFVELYGGAVYRDRRLRPDEIDSLRQLLRKGFAPPS